MTALARLNLVLDLLDGAGHRFDSYEDVEAFLEAGGAASRLVAARNLPARFRIPTTWHQPAAGTARRAGRRVRVEIMGATLLLEPWQRVRVLLEGR